MDTQKKRWRWATWVVLLFTLAMSLAGCFDLSGQEVTRPAFESPLRTPTPAAALSTPTQRWNWQPTATALARISPTAVTLPTRTPYGGPTTPTPALGPPPPTMVPPKAFRAENLQVADVRFVDYASHLEFIGWSPDGTRILVEPHDPGHWKLHPRIAGKSTLLLGLWMMNPDGTERRQVAEWAARSVAWSPDGKYIAYSVPVGDEGTEGVIYVVDVVTLESWKVADTNHFVGWEDIFWLPDNELTFLKDGHIFAVRADGTGTRQLNDIYIALETPEQPTPGLYKISPNGQKVAWMPGESITELWIANLDGSQAILVSDNCVPVGADRAIGWSPDGSYLAFTLSNGLGPASGDLWVVNADGLGPHPVATTEQSWEALRQPTWSPDGQIVAFVRGASGMELSLWIVDRDGTNLHPLGGKRAGVVWFPLWSPTGTQIAYTRQYWEPSGRPNAAVITLQQKP